MTTVIYRADEFGRVKMEQYTQTRLPDGQISLDYSERYETHPERVTHRDVLDAHPEVAAAESQPPTVVVKHNVDDDTDEQSEDHSNQEDAGNEDDLTEEEKKGLYLLFAILYATVFVSQFVFLYFLCSRLINVFISQKLYCQRWILTEMATIASFCFSLFKQCKCCISSGKSVRLSVCFSVVLVFRHQQWLGGRCPSPFKICSQK